MIKNKLLAMPALVGISLGGLVGATPASAAELPLESHTPTFNTESIQIIDQNLANIVSSETPSFSNIDLPVERVSIRVAIDEAATTPPAVIVPAASVTVIEKVKLTSKPKVKPVAKPAPKPVIKAVKNPVNELDSYDIENEISSKPKVKSQVASGSSDAMTRDSRGGVAKTYKDNSIALNYESEGQGMSAVVKAAHAGIGVPYVWGGNTTGGWDCSGFVKWAYEKAGVKIARGTAAIRASGQFVRTTNPQPGDLVFQNGGGHVGIYIGDGKMIGAQNPSVDTILHSVSRNPLYGYYTLKK